MILAEEQLRQMFPNAGRRLDPHLPFIGSALERGDITTPERIAAFLAQVAHESAEYRYMEEIADGSDYEGRLDLGNTHPGDGMRFKGHGPIQITGRANHRACGYALGIPLESEPTLICTPEYGTASAAWFWNSRNLSLLADLGWFTTTTKVINGGTNGLYDRWKYYNRNREILSLRPLYPIGEIDAIRAFQRAHGLVDDGVVGPKTMAAVIVAAEAAPRPLPADGTCTAAPGWDPAKVA
jgi:predicted chitinase